MRMGKVLLAKFGNGKMHALVFTIANLMSKGAQSEIPDVQLEIAKVNLRASQLAADMSALEMASTYAANGVALLTENRWNVQRELTKSLYMVACHAESCLGNHARFT